MLDGGAGVQVVPEQAAVADRHRITGRQPGQPVVDARELHRTVVELTFGDLPGLQVDVQLHNTPSVSNPLVPRHSSGYRTACSTIEFPRS